MNWKPNKWIAALLGLLAQPVGLVYVARPRWAIVYFIVILMLAVIAITGSPIALSMLAMQAMSIVIAVVAAVHALVIATRATVVPTRPAYTRWYGLAGIVAIFLAFILLLRAFGAETFKANSNSMTPSIPLGTFFLTKKWGYGHYEALGFTILRTKISTPLERGDMIVFDFSRDQTRSFVKRVIGLPGDTVVYRHKRLNINEVAVQTSALDSGDDTQRNPSGPRRLSEKLGAAPHLIMVDDGVLDDSTARLPLFPASDQCEYVDKGLKCKVPADNYFVLGDNRDDSVDSRHWGFVPESAVVGKVVRVFPTL
ncbi:MAG: signal peptidase I [Usitatibacteraceae bacterium]